jgi:hypothetical protein
MGFRKLPLSGYETNAFNTRVALNVDKQANAINQSQVGHELTASLNLVQIYSLPFL